MWLLIKNIHEKEKILQSLLKWLVKFKLYKSIAKSLTAINLKMCFKL